MEATDHTVYLALGTNLGNREENISTAYRYIGQSIGTITRRSGLYRSEPWGFSSDNEFVNTVIRCRTTLSPHDVLDRTQAIERLMGRTVKSRNGEYHDRIIDIDILFYDDISIDDPDLTIPHPLMKQRPFVMVPLQEVMQTP